MTARRDTADPSGLGIYPDWAFSWPANRRDPLQPRLLRRRRQALGSEAQGDRRGTATKWAGNDVPDMRARREARGERQPVHHEPGGRRRGSSAPIACRTARSRSTTSRSSRRSPNAFHPKVGPNPAARMFKRDREALGEAGGVPVRRDDLPAHRALPLLDEARARARGAPARVVRRDREALAQKKGIRNGDRVVVRSKRGKIVAKAVVTKRIKPLQIERQGGPHRRHPASTGASTGSRSPGTSRTRSRRSSATPTSRRRSSRRSS